MYTVHTRCVKHAESPDHVVLPSNDTQSRRSVVSHYSRGDALGETSFTVGVGAPHPLDWGAIANNVCIGPKLASLEGTSPFTAHAHAHAHTRVARSHVILLRRCEGRGRREREWVRRPGGNHSG